MKYAQYVDSKSGETLSVHNPVDDSLVVDKSKPQGQMTSTEPSRQQLMHSRRANGASSLVLNEPRAC